MRPRGWLGVIALLVLVDVVIHLVYLPRWLAGATRVAMDGLRDTTFGRNLAIVFTLTERTAATTSPSMVVVGDSTIMGKLGAPQGRRDGDLQ